MGGGGQHQSFAPWDLESGAVRVLANESDPGSQVVFGAELDGKAMFLVGDDCGQVALWDPALVASFDEDEYENPEPTLMTEGNLDGMPGLVTGTLTGKPIVVSHPGDGGVMVWNVRESNVMALTMIDRRPTVVGPSGRSGLLLGDPETGRWVDRIGDTATETGGKPDSGCLDAGHIGGVPIAVTGAEDGTLRMWNLAVRTGIAGPLVAHDGAVSAVRIRALDGRVRAVSAGRDAVIRVWALEAE